MAKKKTTSRTKSTKKTGTKRKTGGTKTKRKSTRRKRKKKTTTASATTTKHTPQRPTLLEFERPKSQRGVVLKGDKLVVSVSRDSHPELYDINELIGLTRSMIETYGEREELSDLVNFLSETERGLEIILSNHLEDAIRDYLGGRPV